MTKTSTVHSNNHDCIRGEGYWTFPYLLPTIKVSCYVTGCFKKGTKRYEMNIIVDFCHLKGNYHSSSLIQIHITSK